MDLYHVDICLPNGFEEPTQIVKPVYSRHAQRAAQNDRYGTMILPRTISLKDYRVIEVGIENERIAKILFRGRYDNNLDICIVMIPGSWFVKTVWFQEADDDHRTLDRTRYVGVA